jgi:hypothetical protein
MSSASTSIEAPIDRIVHQNYHVQLNVDGDGRRLRPSVRILPF